MISKEQAEVYEIICNLGCKVFLVLVSAGVFLATAIQLMIAPNWYIAVFDGVWAVSIGPVMHHYFPARSPAKHPTTKATKGKQKTAAEKQNFQRNNLPAPTGETQDGSEQ